MEEEGNTLPKNKHFHLTGQEINIYFRVNIAQFYIYTNDFIYSHNLVLKFLTIYYIPGFFTISSKHLKLVFSYKIDNFYVCN